MSESNPEIDYKNLYRANLPLGVTFSPINSNYYYNGQRFNNITPVEFYRNYLFATMGFTASPLALFANNEAGVWYDPSQAANLDWRRNLLAFTEQFDNAGWGKSNATVTTNVATAPDGTTTADFLVENTANTSHWFGGGPVPTSLWPDNTSYTASVYVKAAGRSFFWLESITKTPTFPQVFFNLENGLVSNTYNGATGSIQSVGDGWYRCTLTANSLTGTSSPNIIFGPAINGSAKTYIGNGTSGVYVWGAQLELGSTATAYQRITDVNTEVMERFPQATLFQDTAGTIPVTTAGQTVGLMLDKSKGLALGPELITNGDFDTNTDWTVNAGWTIADGVASYSGTGSATRITQSLNTVAGVTYEVTFTVTITSGTGNVRISGGSTSLSGPAVSASGTYTQLILSPGGTAFDFFGSTTAVLTVDNISVKELAGNHATQATAASRPTYGIVPFGGRRNLLTWAEQFDNAVWTKSNTTVTANAAIAPDGTNTADLLAENTANAVHLASCSLASLWPDNTSYTASVYVKAAGRSIFWMESRTKTPTFPLVFFDLTSGQVSSTANGATGSIQAVGDGWYRCTLTANSLTGTFSPNILFGPALVSGSRTYTGDGTSGLFIWGAQLEAGSTATAYQRVTTQYDVTEAGVPPVAYLAFDGVDDFMVTPTITPNIDKVQVFAGLRKLSDAAIGMVVELSANSGGANGSLYLIAPNSISAAGYEWRSRGTTAVQATAGSGFASPITSVLTGLGDISGDLATLRIDGTQAAQNTGDQGTGNYLAYPLYIGRRGGTSVPLNGQLYSLVTRFGSNLEANDIANTETYVASKTGVTL